MHRYTTYPEYKPSDGNWIGDIPVGWEVKRLKFLLTEPLKYGANESAELSDTDLPRYIRITDVKDDGSLRAETFRSLPEDIAKPYLLDEGDILLARSGATVGKTFIYRKPWGRAAFAGYLIRARTNRNILNADFAYYFLQSSVYWQWLNSVSIQATIQNVSAEKYASLFIPLPDLSQQRIIARFLDFKTAQIDTLIAKKQALLEKLAEKRTALISHAVTKGLDPKVPMRDSGVVWVGKIPSHWTIRRLKDVGRLIGGAGFPHDLQNVQDEELYFYKVGDLSLSENGKTLLSSPHTINRETAKTLRASVIPKESIVYAKIGAALLLNRRRMTTSECCIDNNMTAYVVNRDRVSPDWAFYWLTTIDFAEHVNPGAVPSFSEGYQSVLSIPLPPIDEQENIVSFLDEHTTQIDRQVKKIEAVIETLLEYRSAIITNAVTGKIDVRDFPLSLNVAS